MVTILKSLDMKVDDTASDLDNEAHFLSDLIEIAMSQRANLVKDFAFSSITES